MKRYLFIPFLLFFFYSGSAQTDRQINLVRSFFGNSAASIVAGMAHPLSTRQSYSVTHEGHQYFITIYYTYGGDQFNCTHVFSLNSDGNPTGYHVWQCNAPGFWKCFEGLGVTKNIIGYFSEQEKETLPRLLGKALTEIDMEDACFARLYYSWKEGGYYSAY